MSPRNTSSSKRAGSSMSSASESEASSVSGSAGFFAFAAEDFLAGAFASITVSISPSGWPSASNVCHVILVSSAFVAAVFFSAVFFSAGTAAVLTIAFFLITGSTFSTFFASGFFFAAASASASRSYASGLGTRSAFFVSCATPCASNVVFPSGWPSASNVVHSSSPMSASSSPPSRGRLGGGLGVVRRVGGGILRRGRGRGARRHLRLRRGAGSGAVGGEGRGGGGGGVGGGGGGGAAAAAAAAGVGAAAAAAAAARGGGGGGGGGVLGAGVRSDGGPAQALIPRAVVHAVAVLLRDVEAFAGGLTAAHAGVAVVALGARRGRGGLGGGRRGHQVRDDVEDVRLVEEHLGARDDVELALLGGGAPVGLALLGRSLVGVGLRSWPRPPSSRGRPRAWPRSRRGRRRGRSCRASTCTTPSRRGWRCRRPRNRGRRRRRGRRGPARTHRGRGVRSGTTSMTSRVSNASVNMFPSSAEGSTPTFLPLERTGCLRSAPTEGRAETRDAVDLALASRRVLGRAEPAGDGEHREDAARHERRGDRVTHGAGGGVLLPLGRGEQRGALAQGVVHGGLNGAHRAGRRDRQRTRFDGSAGPLFGEEERGGSRRRTVIDRVRARGGVRVRGPGTTRSDPPGRGYFFFRFLGR